MSRYILTEINTGLDGIIEYIHELEVNAFVELRPINHDINHSWFGIIIELAETS